MISIVWAVYFEPSTRSTLCPAMLSTRVSRCLYSHLGLWAAEERRGAAAGISVLHLSLRLMMIAAAFLVLLRPYSIQCVLLLLLLLLGTIATILFFCCWHRRLRNGKHPMKSVLSGRAKSRGECSAGRGAASTHPRTPDIFSYVIMVLFLCCFIIIIHICSIEITHLYSCMR